MKIFSLESKGSLLGWSIVLGFVVNTAIFEFTKRVYIACTFWPCQRSFEAYRYGWPIVADTGDLGPAIDVKPIYLLNLFFWFFSVLIILSLIRYFRNKNNPAI